MKQSEVIKEIKAKTGIPTTKVSKVLKAMVDIIHDLEVGDKATIERLAVFSKVKQESAEYKINGLVGKSKPKTRVKVRLSKLLITNED